MIRLEQTDHLPGAPGAYLFKDEGGSVLYVGKAGDLRKRVRTHVSGKSHIQEQDDLLDRAVVVDYIVTDNEVEALLLEHSLIKKHRPRYNIRLKDDKRYPFIKVTIGETYPRVFLTRKVEDDGSLYFGPYPHVKSARAVLNLLTRIFPIRSCSHPSEDLTKQRACLDFEIKRCVAPCIGLAGPEEYRDLVGEVIRFLEGKRSDIRRHFEQRMKACSANREYEKAAVYRDRLRAIDEMQERQKVIRTDGVDEDYIGLGQFGSVEAAAVLHYRMGIAIGGVHYFFEGSGEASREDRLRSFLIEFYSRSSQVPQRIYVPENLEDEAALTTWLNRDAERKVELLVPVRGDKKQLLDLAEKNARLRAEEEYRKTRGFREKVDPAVVALQEALALPDLPIRIEGYDVSNIQGVMATGSMVVFQGGHPAKGHYRKFRIRYDEGKPNDYAMMQEMIRRRFGRRDDEKFGALPDLILIDGGLGHLHSVIEVMEDPIPVISIAKREEWIYTEGGDEALVFQPNSPALKLLMRIRDEAHRFGLGYHLKLREKGLRKSILDDVEGIGKKRKKELLRHFGSVDGVRRATIEEIAEAPGISTSLAKRIKEAVGEPEEPTLTTAYIGLGTNLGNREENLSRAIALMNESEGMRVLRVSSFHESPPEGIADPAAPPFLNAVAEIETIKTPRELLETLQGIERELGKETLSPEEAVLELERRKTVEKPYSSRTIDLDILLYGDETVNEPDLVIPHPRMKEREFVMMPLRELTRS